MDGQTVSNMDTSMNTSLNTSLSFVTESHQLGNKCIRVFVDGQNKQGGRYTVKELREHE